MESKPLYYADYLQLDKILQAQSPVSFRAGNHPAHDEMLFITIHQAYEIWFKQILFELDYTRSVFRKETINDNSEDLNLVRHRLHRVIRILHLLVEQVHILDTMTPLDFLAFRNLLTPSSGFQSKQFRQIEAMLGLETTERHRHEYYKRRDAGGFTEADYAAITDTEAGQSIRALVNQWLERMPFFEIAYWQSFETGHTGELHPFWQHYRKLYQHGLTEREAGKLADFDQIFLEARSDENPSAASTRFSPAALRSALFIMLYRDFPVFQTSYQILDALIEIDHLMGDWRHKHLTMVRRMIGMRVGTGNTSGAGYLEGALQQHYVFHDLAGLSTFLIERRQLPKLPEDLIRHLNFYH